MSWLAGCFLDLVVPYPILSCRLVYLVILLGWFMALADDKANIVNSFTYLLDGIEHF